MFISAAFRILGLICTVLSYNAVKSTQLMSQAARDFGLLHLASSALVMALRKVGCDQAICACVWGGIYVWGWGGARGMYV